MQLGPRRVVVRVQHADLEVAVLAAVKEALDFSLDVEVWMEISSGNIL